MAVSQSYHSDFSSKSFLSKGKLMVVAFDIGTTYSGYAYSFEGDPTTIRMNKPWTGASDKLMSWKTPTCLLVRPDLKVHSIGFEAEKHYSSLVEDGEEDGWKLFRRFKMVLYQNKNISRSLCVEDISGRKGRAYQVFSDFIKLLIGHFRKAVDLSVCGVQDKDIQYIMTVPAIWDDSAKLFMRNIATEAGIPSENLKLALEPECASVWCQTHSELGVLLPTSVKKYMVADLGGGTVDIVIHEKLPNGLIREMYKVTGNNSGGVAVDANFIELLKEIFGQQVIETFKKEQSGEYFDLLEQFEIKKRSFGAESGTFLTFKVQCLRELFEQKSDQSLKTRLQSDYFKDKVTLANGDKLRIRYSCISRCFRDPVKTTITHMKMLLTSEELRTVKTVLLVGGFAESPYVQARIKEDLSDWNVIVPTDPGVAILKGAVVFGHRPTVICSRIMRYTYGIECREEFNFDTHPPSKMKIVNGNTVVDQCFGVYVAKNSEMPVNQEVMRRNCFLINPSSRGVVLNVYRSNEINPKFVTDAGCEKLGVLEVPFPDARSENDTLYDITFVCGDTELTVKAYVHKTRKESYLTLRDALT